MADTKISALTAHTTIIDADSIPIVDSTAAATKKSLWSVIKSTLKTYFDTLYVALSGNQTVAGVKTFSSFPVTPSSAPTTDYQVANKKYVDDNAAGMTNPMTASGDIIYGGTSGAATRLPKGTDGHVLKLASGIPSWAAESGGGGGGITVISEITANTTLSAASHANKFIPANHATGMNLTIEGSEFAANDLIAIEQTGNGVITIIQGTGMTLNGALKTWGQYSVIHIFFKSATVATVIGGSA